MKKWIIGTCLLFCFFITNHLAAKNFHVIILTDLHSLDIQAASYVDLQNIYEISKAIAKHGDFKSKVSILSDEKKAGKKLLDLIKSLKVQKNDAILFYFSGHGYSTISNKNNPWPYLDLPAEQASISFKKIIDLLASKKARFSLLIADCCNWELSYHYAPAMLKGQNWHALPKTYKKNYKQLFCQTKGLIAIAGAQRGQASYCSPQGSFFTLSLLNSLKIALHDEGKSDWLSILTDASSHLDSFLQPHNLKQVPFLHIDID